MWQQRTPLVVFQDLWWISALLLIVITLSTSSGALASLGKGAHHQQHLPTAVRPLAPVTPRHINLKWNLSAKSHGATPAQISETFSRCNCLQTSDSSQFQNRPKAETSYAKQCNLQRKASPVQGELAHFTEKTGYYFVPHQIADSRQNKVLNINGKLQS